LYSIFFAGMLAAWLIPETITSLLVITLAVCVWIPTSNGRPIPVSQITCLPYPVHLCGLTHYLVAALAIVQYIPVQILFEARIFSFLICYYGWRLHQDSPRYRVPPSRFHSLDEHRWLSVCPAIAMRNNKDWLLCWNKFRVIKTNQIIFKKLIFVATPLTRMALVAYFFSKPRTRS